MEDIFIVNEIDGKECYPPKEDSYLLAKYVEKFARGEVLDMGTGTGILAIVAAKKEEVIRVFAVDISEECLQIAKYNAKMNEVGNKIVFVHSNLFEKVPKRKFDVLVFNPPYLPEEGIEDEKTRLWTVGGKKGNEIILEFLENAKDYMKENSIILLLLSSLSDIEEVNYKIIEEGYEYEILEKKKYFFETLYAYKIWKKDTER